MGGAKVDARDLPWSAETRRKIVAAWLRVLRSKVPTDHPVYLGRDLPPVNRVRPAAEEECLGKCSFDGARYHLRFAVNLSRYETQDSLVHEYAHAVAGLTGEDRTDHGREWGAAKARVYRALVG